MAIRQEATLHVGPIPPPSDFDAYNQVVPGAAGRILAMAEEDAAHVRLTQRRAQVFTLIERLAARLFSLTFASGALGLAGYLALQGHDTVAGIIAGTTIGAVVAALIYGRGPSSGGGAGTA